MVVVDQPFMPYKSSCVKCGTTSPNVQWHSEEIGCTTSEHMHCYCRLCGYEWAELPQDRFDFEPPLTE